MPNRVDPSRSVVLKGSTYNWIVDNITRLLASHGGSGPSHASRDGAIYFHIKNTSGTNIPRCGIMTPAGPLLSVSSEVDFTSSRDWSGGPPTSGDIYKPFCVAPRPIVSQQVGRAVMAGPVTVKLQVQSDLHQYARPVSGDATKLESCLEPTRASILWKESSGTGLKWARVFLGPRPVQLSYRGVTTGSIAAGASGNVTLYLGTGTSDPVTQLVYHDWMAGGQAVSAGKQIEVQYFPSENLWRIVGAECEA